MLAQQSLAFHVIKCVHVCVTKPSRKVVGGTNWTKQKPTVLNYPSAENFKVGKKSANRLPSYWKKHIIQVYKMEKWFYLNNSNWNISSQWRPLWMASLLKLMRWIQMCPKSLSSFLLTIWWGNIYADDRTVYGCFYIKKNNWSLAADLFTNSSLWGKLACNF